MLYLIFILSAHKSNICTKPTKGKKHWSFLSIEKPNAFHFHSATILLEEHSVNNQKEKLSWNQICLKKKDISIFSFVNVIPFTKIKIQKSYITTLSYHYCYFTILFIKIAHTIIIFSFTWASCYSAWVATINTLLVFFAC